MIFNSLVYAAFLPCVLLIYSRLGHRAQNVFLLGASYLFYGWWDWRFLSLLLLSTLVDFTVARRLHAAEGAARKQWLWLSLAVNLGVLGFFKYAGFFTDTFADAMRTFGWNPGAVTLQLVLPVGISFYTFQTLAYTIDVYRRELEPTDDLVDFALYVSFFPQLVAGPIERAQTLLPQLANPRTVTLEDVRVGLALVAIGLLRKVGIADAVAGRVDHAFANPTQLSKVELLFALYLFAIQIYGDFAGYSSIARGSARLLGVELMRNFDQPYLSTSITMFWRRWHRSLSSWLRDYLYIPLGGNRHGTLNTYRNLFLTMLLGGLWHGAAWGFVLWGALHGTALAVHKLWMGPRRNAGADWSTVVGTLKGLAGIVLTFHFVLFTWLFFRAKHLEEAWAYLGSLLYAPWTLGLEWERGWMVAVYGALVVTLDVVQARARNQTPMLALSWPVRGLLLGLLMVWLLVFGGIDADIQFIYFQF